MLSFEKVDLAKNLCNFLAIFQRLEYQQNYQPKRKKNDILKETTSTSLYLTKDDFLHKHKKCELATEVNKPFKKECLSEVPMYNKRAMLVVNFLAYTRKVPVKKAKLKTYGDMAKHLWNTFTKFASDYTRIGFIFD